MGFFKTEKEKLQRRFRKARERHDAEGLRKAILEGAEIDNRDDGRTQLYRAVYSNFAEGVKILLEAGANPNCTADNGHTALMEASRDGSFEVAKMLIERGADINAQRNDGLTALHLAAQAGRGSVVKLLIEKGADRLAVDHRMNSAADLADKEHPRLADLIRGKMSPDYRRESDEPATGWHLTAPDEVSSIAEKPDIGYRLTEIFNFGSGIYTQIAQNVKTKAESQSVRFFDEFGDRAAIDKARQALVQLGGQAADSAAKKLDKPSLPRTQGGTP